MLFILFHVKLSFPFITCFSGTFSGMTLNTNIMLDILTLCSYENYSNATQVKKRFYQTNKNWAKCGQS